MPKRRKTGPREAKLRLPDGVTLDGDTFTATVTIPYGRERVKRGFATPDQAAAFIEARKERVETRRNPKWAEFSSHLRLAHLKPAP